MKIRIVAKQEDRFLQSINSEKGRVIIPGDKYVGPIHSISSILLRGFWEEFRSPIEIEIPDELKVPLKKLNEEKYSLLDKQKA